MLTTRRDFLQGSVALAALPYLTLPLTAQTPAAAEELWYVRPAERWLEALPVGNGRLGGMVFGGNATERIALSESTAWSGAPATGEVNPDALSHLSEIRELFFNGNYDEAQALCAKYLPGHAKNFGTNLPLSDLLLHFSGSDTAMAYRRSLNLGDATAHVSYRSEDATFTREFFATHADGLLVVRLACTQPKLLGFRLEFDKGVLPNTVSTNGNDTLVQQGDCYEKMHSSGHDGVAFEIRAKVIAEGGTTAATDQAIEVRGADVVTVLVAIGTSYGGADPGDTCKEMLQRAANKSYAELRERHVADYQPLYRRMSLDLGETPAAVRRQPIDVRRKAMNNGAEDPELLALFFQYGRYLTIAGSRADSPLPLALQGIWNDGLASSMGWTDDFHLDINTQQNYWAAEVSNLSECQMPLFRLIERLRSGGRTTAKEMYGAPGWVAHTVTNPWGFTAPGSPGWGIFVTAGIWISQQIWDHYTFTGDTEFLGTQAYPVLREAAEFFLAYMTPEPKHGWLVTGPSDSPENWFIAPSGHHIAESMGNTVDRVFVYALYSMCIEASKTLSTDEEFRTKLEGARAKLPPFQVGRHGQLQEWLEDFEDAVPNHRHTSHLVSVYPENQISPRRTPELARAAEITIQRRINAPHWEQSEWGRANLVAYYARLLKGNEALVSLAGLVAKAADDNLLTYSSGGIAGAQSNIFALDGNTAGTAGIAEMLVQSQADEIELLPALPAAWRTGSVRGLCARGGFVVDIAWRDGRLESALIKSKRGVSTPVRLGDRVITIHLQPKQTTRLREESFHAVEKK
ncbi:glycoside hydrolase family 95 protein [Edaphobacter bradus]|uniref:glycoside hydrolase family 95 protein n=1 Tax=Edaphobacter bradus TaxID=2259016 RepID=UPI0021DF6AD8|nr:glycoside hydrolase family 95 protein [Edaphobacter bradus]